ncbi:MAG: hypothetical protein AB7I50_02335 [Vicinamibacterales bacterium]
MPTTLTRNRLSPVGITLFCLAVACGGGGSPTQPSGSGSSSGSGSGSGGSTGSTTVTITITASGVSPNQVTIAPGQRVLFVNNNTRAHEMNSDPHPEHTDCPAINQVGFIQPGQSRETGNLNTVRTCRFHDHNQPGNTSLEGSIVIR